MGPPGYAGQKGISLCQKLPRELRRRARIALGLPILIDIHADPDNWIINRFGITALRGNYESLTPREREVMRCVVAGMLNKQIGLQLGISEITVKAHRGKMIQKMKADSLADLVKTAVRLGLAPARNPWRGASNDG